MDGIREANRVARLRAARSPWYRLRHRLSLILLLAVSLLLWILPVLSYFWPLGGG
jgi:hypothetical protein